MAGGQVFMIPADYYGPVAAGNAIGQIGQGVNNALEQRRENKREDRRDLLSETLLKYEMVKSAGRPEDVTAFVNAEFPKLGFGESNLTPEVAFETIAGRYKTQLLARVQRGEKLSPQDQQLLTGSAISPDTQQRGAEVGVAQGEQELEKGKVNIRSMLFDQLRQVREQFGTATAQTFARAQKDILGEFATQNLQPNMQDIQQKLIERLGNDPKMQQFLYNNQFSGDGRGPDAANASANLRDQDVRSGINLRGAQARNLEAETKLREAAAIAESDPLKHIGPAANKFLEAGVPLPTLLKYFSAPGTMTPQENAVLNSALVKMQLASGMAGGQLELMASAMKAGIEVPTEVQATAMAQTLSAITGEQWQSQRKVRNNWFDGDWTATKVTQPTQQPPGQDPATNPLVQAVQSAKAAGESRENLVADANGVTDPQKRAAYIAAIDSVYGTATPATPAAPAPTPAAPDTMPLVSPESRLDNINKRRAAEGAPPLTTEPPLVADTQVPTAATPQQQQPAPPPQAPAQQPARRQDPDIGRPSRGVLLQTVQNVSGPKRRELDALVKRLEAFEKKRRQLNTIAGPRQPAAGTQASLDEVQRNIRTIEDQIAAKLKESK